MAEGELHQAVAHDGTRRVAHGTARTAMRFAVVCIWEEFERSQKLLTANAYGKAGGVKSGRGGRALLPGLLLCGRCGRRLTVAYSGRAPGQPVYRCERPNQMLGRARCVLFAAKRVDTAIAREVFRALEPMAIEAGAASRTEVRRDAK